jgi:hypothetical protein
MDLSVRLPVPWIISFVALVGAYKLGSWRADARKLKAEGHAGSEDSGEEESDSEEKEPREESKGDGTGEKKSGSAKSKSKSKSKAKAKEGKKIVKNDDWEWPVYDAWWSNYSNRNERKLRANEKKVKPDASPFEVTYTQRYEWPDEVTVKLRSKPLIEVAKKCVSKHLEELIIEEPEINARELFIALGSFEQDYRSIQEDDPSLPLQYHLKHLIRFLKTEYRDANVHVDRMRREKVVRWDLLWAFLHKGERVYYTCAMTGQMLQGTVWLTYYGDKDRSRTDEKYFRVKVKCCNYNGNRFLAGSVKIDIKIFKGESSFESIGVCPLSLLEQSEKERLEAMFLDNGRRFYHIASQRNLYMQFKGPRLEMVRPKAKHEWELKKQKADGRVMVDLLSFARMNPGYPLKDAEPWVSSSPHNLTCVDTEMPSEDDLMFAPAVVFGFSFSNKKWGGFDVNRLSAIQFNDQAFDRDLVLLNSQRKGMLLALVSEYVQNPRNAEDTRSVDPITNKGNGCIFLCYGPPGTGKTLTAESIAEKLKRPLWSINVFELGRTPESLEMNLLGILEVAAEWRAVLLLDEADIYMEKRTSNGDPNRTAMTAIFLRLLEYYRGVLFLTTNRISSFDDAFCSRISMFLRYHRLSRDQRDAIWRNLFARAGVANPDLAPFIETDLNGREICNTVRIAQTWARSSGEELTTGHVLEVVNMLGEFCEDLEGAIKKGPDERSITRALNKVRSMKAGRDIRELNGNFLPVVFANDD